MNNYSTKNSKRGLGFVRRVLALGITTGMLVTILPSVSAAQYTEPSTIVDYFSTFNGYEQNGGSYFANAKLPDGWTSANWTGDKSWRISGYSDSETGSNIMRTKDSSITYKFSEPVKSGKLHISFDAKTDARATVNIGGYNASVNDNPDDCWNADGTYYTYSYFIKMRNDNTGENIYIPSYSANGNTGSGNENSVETNDGKWHKYDVFINFDTENEDKSYGQLSVYQDGDKLGDTIPMTAPYAKSQNSIKSLFVQTTWIAGIEDASQPQGYFDNFYVHNYKSDENFEAPKIALDYPNSGVLSDNGTIDVVFSEALESDEFIKPQFEIKNMATGKKVDIVSVSNIPSTSGARISLPTLEPGEYEVSVRNILGMTSGKAVENTANFTVAGAQVGNSARYYINENFNSYKGGMPTDFKKLGTVASNDLTSTEVESGNKALNLGGSADEAISYEFNNSIYSGKFTVEFDVKHSGAGWTLGLMDKSDFFSNTDYIAKADYEQEKNNVSYSHYTSGKADGTITEADFGTWANAKTLDPSGTLTNKDYYFNQWTKEQFDSEKTDNPQREWLYKRINAFENRRKNNTLIGNMLKDDADRTKLSTAKARSNSGDTEISGLTVPANTWTKVKAVVDLDAGKYYFYTNDSAEPIEVAYNQAKDGNYDSARFARTYLRDTDGNYKVLGGISGLRLQKYGDGSVEFDNIKVYTDKSYNDYLDFNTASTGVSTQPGWYSNKAKAWSDHQYFGNNGENTRLQTNGVNFDKDSSDKAIEFTQGWQYYTHPFAVPVKAAQAFTVEFDLFADDNTRWYMSLLDDKFMERSVENSGASSIAFNGKNGTGGTQTMHTMEQNGILTNTYGSSNTVGFATAAGTNFTPQYAGDFDNVDIAYNTNKWQHIKLEFAPASGEQMTLKLYVTCDGETKTSKTQWLRYSSIESGKSRLYKYDTCGLAFVIPGGFGDGAGMTIDNLKVTETAAAVKSAVTAITSTDEKGEQVDLTDKLYKIGDEISDINVEFSAPVNSTDEITLYYPQDDSGAVPTYTVTLSEDKKSAVIHITECEMNKNVTLCIGNKLDIGTTNLAAPDTTSATFKVEQASDELVIEDFRLYEYIDGRTFGTYSCDGIWVPVSADKLDGDKYTTFNGLKIVAKGYNSGSPKNVLMMSGIYNNTETVSNLLSANEVENADVPTGRFDNVEYVISNTDTDANMLKCFIWDTTTLKPLWDKLVYEKTAKTVTE